MTDPSPDATLEDDWQAELEDDDGALPPRARRKLVTPMTAGLAGVLIAAAGFLGGVEVQKGQDDGSGAAAAAAGGGGRAAGFAGARGGAAGAGADGAGAPTFGSVANKQGSTLYVTSADGTTVRVKTNAQSKVTRNAAASPRGIFPGDTVVVQGTKDKAGDLVATQITATSKTAAAAGGGFRAAFGGGAGAGAPAGGPPAGAPGG
jgi:hypothetical protein